MPSPLFSATNSHIESCGTPTLVETNQFRYAAYFCNSDREQWVLTVAKDDDTIYLRGGDCGWDVEYEVVPHPRNSNFPYVEDLILGKAEYAWLLSCWLAINQWNENVDLSVFNASFLTAMLPYRLIT